MQAKLLNSSRLSERGAQGRFVLEHSLYQQAKLHPVLTTALAVAGGWRWRHSSVPK